MLRATARPRGPVVPPMAQQLQTGAGGGGGAPPGFRSGSGGQEAERAGSLVLPALMEKRKGERSRNSVQVCPEDNGRAGASAIPAEPSRGLE